MNTKKIMPLPELIIRAIKEYESNKPNYRFGQYLFHKIGFHNPKVADEIVGTEYDPYYCEGKIPQKMYDKIQELWDKQ